MRPCWVSPACGEKVKSIKLYHKLKCLRWLYNLDSRGHPLLETFSREQKEETSEGATEGRSLSQDRQTFTRLLHLQNRQKQNQRIYRLQCQNVIHVDYKIYVKNVDPRGQVSNLRCCQVKLSKAVVSLSVWWCQRGPRWCLPWGTWSWLSP